MNDFFETEAFRKSSSPFVNPAFEAMRAAHYRVPPGLRLDEHVATHARVLYCVDGSLVCMINYTQHLVTTNQAVITLPGDFISCHTSAPATEYRLIAFDGHSTCNHFHGMGLWGGVFNVANIPTKRFELLFGKLQENSAASIAKATSIGNDMLAVLHDDACMFAEDKAVFQMQQFFIRNWRNPEINVASALAHISAGHNSISKRFQQLTGYTLLDYLTCLRLRHACRLLKQSTNKKHSIAASSGFPDPAYFSRVFKRTMGVTPSEFAKLSCDDYHAVMRKLLCGSKPDASDVMVESQTQSPLSMAINRT